MQLYRNLTEVLMACMILICYVFGAWAFMKSRIPVPALWRRTGENIWHDVEHLPEEYANRDWQNDPELEVLYHVVYTRGFCVLGILTFACIVLLCAGIIIPHH